MTKMMIQILRKSATTASDRCGTFAINVVIVLMDSENR